MPLSAGTKLGPYEIVAPLGAGGMGEVYRARDARLGRDVAIKVLPQHLSANPEVRARFEREAKTVSGLNHPNICTLFDVGREGDIDYLVMELVEGETLAQRLSKGALPPADVLRLGAQIADALDRAHRAGVIHRDLKPGNVMLTRSGAKLMDFGLARATGMAGPAGASGLTHAALTQSPTVAQALTAEGTLVGTFQYMSPEQLEGREADTRSDLWALGCVLYEMATGRRAFEGRSQASLISVIMTGQPAPLSQVSSVAPPALERVVSACLAKDAADRIQSAHDVKLQLGWISEPGSVSGVAPGAPVAPSHDGKQARFSRISLVVGVLGLIAAAVAGGMLFARRSPVLVTQVATPRNMRLSNYWTGLALSPSGTAVVAVGHVRNETNRLWLWHLDAVGPVELPGTELAQFPNWSPDGRSIAFRSGTSKAILRVPVSGGEPTKLCETSDARGLSWGAKNVIVYAPSPSGPLYKIPAGGGTPELATELDPSRREASHRFPWFLPDGEHFLFAALPAGPRGFTIRVGSLGSKRSSVLMVAESGAMYAAPGYLVFVQGGKVTARRFDLGRLALVGDPYTIDDAPIIADMDAETVASASHDGRLLYPVIQHPDARLEWLDRSGAPRGVVALPTGDWRLASLSPDQKSALATRDGDLWQVDLERAVPSRLLQNIDPAENAQWSPDGRYIVATNHESGREVLRILNAGGGGKMDSVGTVPSLFQEPESWSPDGRSLLVAVLGGLKQGEGEATSWDLVVAPIAGGEVRPYVTTPAYERQAQISPDGRWAAWVSRSDGKVDLLVDSYPEPGHRLQVFSGEQDREFGIIWGRGGRELLYGDAEHRLVSVPLEPEGDHLRAGQPTLLFEFPGGVTSTRSRDGEHFLVSRQDQAAPGPSMRLVLNWTGLLKR